MPKLRILHLGESTILDTGYSTYSREVNRRLHASGRYEVAELACYDDGSDPRGREAPWKVYPNIPTDPAEIEAYRSSRANAFGEYRFHDACLDFRPDVVWDVRDPWMCEFSGRSPFRRHFRRILMPTVDSEPQRESSLADIIDADAAFCYSDWGLATLRRESGGLANLLGTAPPGADTTTFRVLDKEGARRALGIATDALVVGTVMRNQPRKLYPDLIDAFRKFLDLAPGLADRALLYLHTTYPDKGWDIPRLIKQSGISSRILVTYLCADCERAVALPFQDATVACEACGGRSEMPASRRGVSRSSLALVLNAMDAYVQYATNEGFGMPMVEAAACGVPVFATDYSAMADVVRKVGGHPIRVLYKPLEASTGAHRAIPDPDDFARALVRHFELPGSMRLGKSRRAREAVLAHYDWDRTAARWMAAFDGLSPAVPWDAPPRIHTPQQPPRDLSTNEEFVRWSIRHHLGRPELAHSYLALRLIRDLNWGKTTSGVAGPVRDEDSILGDREACRPFGVGEVLAELGEMVARANALERRRCSPPPNPFPEES